MSKSTRRLKPVTQTQTTEPASVVAKGALELLETRRNHFVKTRSTEGIADFLKDVISSFSSQPDKVHRFMEPLARSHLMLMVVGDAYFYIKKYEDGLRWLAYGLHKCPDLLLTQAQAFDSFTALSVKDWHWSWLRLRTELCEESPCKEFTILEFSDRKFADPALVLRKELNCYFCGKQALLEELTLVGAALEDNSSHYIDNALGVLAQGIGFYWGDAEQEIGATLLVRKALKVLEDGAENEKSSSKVNLVFSLVWSLATVWHAFCLLKNYQDRAVKDLEFASRLEKRAAPGKFEGLETSGRIIPAISKLTIQNELQIADLFIEGIDLLYAIVQYDESEAKAWINHVGPALVVVTVRLLAHRVAMLGDAYNSIRVWYIAFMLGKWYTLRRLVIVSGSELIRLIPNLSSRISKPVDDACNYVTNGWPENSLAKSYILRVHLAKSIACLQKREYEQGLNHLRAIFDYNATLSGGVRIIDAISHLIAESQFVLAQYKALEMSHDLKVDMGPDHTKLVAMSPAAIASKACKTLTGLFRSSVIRLGGWQDLAHNFHILQTVTEVYPPTLLLIKDSGRMRDARVFIADFIYVAQQFCLISRTLQAIVPLIEIELITKAFDSGQRKIECLLKLLDSYKKEIDDVDEDLPRTGSQNLYEQLTSLGMKFTPEDLKKINYEWQLPEANVPQRYKWSGKPSEKPTFQWLPSQRITIPKYLSHSLDCACYLCRHPFIGALTVRFLQVQARYACYAERPGTSLSLLYCAKFFSARAMARASSQYFPLCYELQAVLTPEATKSVVALANTQWHFRTAFDWITTLMEITPFEDIEIIIKQYNYLLEGIKFYDPADRLLPMVPLEIMGAALFLYLSKMIPNYVRGSDFREKYRALATATPEVVTLDSDDEMDGVEMDGVDKNEKDKHMKSPSPDFLLSTPPEQQAPKTPIVCLEAPKKRRGRPPKAKN